MPHHLSPLFTWRSAIAGSDLSSHNKLVAFVLSLHMSELGDSCFPSRKCLVAKTSLSMTTVKKAINELEALGWLQVDRGSGTRTSHYSAVVPGMGGSGDDPLGGRVPTPGGSGDDPVPRQSSRQKDPSPTPSEEPPASSKNSSKDPRLAQLIKDMGDYWTEKYAGEPAWARLGAVAKKFKARITREESLLEPEESLERFEPEEVLARWKTYIDETEARFASAERFFQTYGSWKPKNSKSYYGGRWHDDT